MGRAELGAVMSSMTIAKRRWYELIKVQTKLLGQERTLMCALGEKRKETHKVTTELHRLAGLIHKAGEKFSASDCANTKGPSDERE